MKHSDSTFKPFGYHGITAIIPSDWELGAVDGNFQKGYIRIDDLDMPRLEIKWSTPKYKVPLESSFEAFEQALRKGSKKSGLDFRLKKDIKLKYGRKMFSHKQVKMFYWSSDVHAYCILWRCDICNRVMLAQFLMPLSEDNEELASRILKSIEDHPQKEHNLWAIYDLYAKIPKRFRLEQAELKAGFLSLILNFNKEYITIQRWSAADVLLGSNSLEQWLLSHKDKRLTDLCILQDDIDIYEHKAVWFSGRRRRSFGTLGFIKKLNVRGVLWHCSHTNKIFSAIV